MIQPLFRSKGRNPFKKFVGFPVDLKVPKCPFEIKWPLESYIKYEPVQKCSLYGFYVGFSSRWKNTASEKLSLDLEFIFTLSFEFFFSSSWQRNNKISACIKVWEYRATFFQYLYVILPHFTKAKLEHPSHQLKLFQ